MRSSSSIEEASCFCRLSWTISSDDSSSSARWVLHMRRTQRDHGTEHLDLHLKLLHVLGCSQSDILVYMLLFAHLHRYWKPPSYLPFDFVLLFLLSLFFCTRIHNLSNTDTLGWWPTRPNISKRQYLTWPLLWRHPQDKKTRCNMSRVYIHNNVCWCVNNNFALISSKLFYTFILGWNA